MADDLEVYPDRIAQTFVGKTVLVTGATGFIGKVFIEKLLRCFEVKRIYMLIREKWSKDVNQRAEEVFKKALFNKIREIKGEQFMDKCTVIPYDLTRSNLGLSQMDRQILINEVEIVCHSAAEIRFDDLLKRIILTNIRGVKYMLDLAKEMKKLKVFVHVSTVYCHPNEKVLHEKVYSAIVDPHELLKAVESMSEDEVEKRKSELMRNMPNIYAFTKQLSEALCVEQFDNLPVVVVRPSIVLPIWREPIPGWFDSLNGPMGLCVATGKGVMRGMYGNPNSLTDFIPIDILINAIVCCIWGTTIAGNPRRIFNMCTSSEYKITYGELIQTGLKTSEMLPFNNIVWRPRCKMYRSKLPHRISLLFFNYLPAIIVDGILICLRYKPLLWRIQQKLIKGMITLEYYANNEWDFRNDESIRDRDLLNPRERELYKLDGSGMNYEDYHLKCTHAARLYIFKETDDTIPAAKRHMKMMYWIDAIAKYLFYLWMLYLAYKYVFVPFFGKIL